MVERHAGRILFRKLDPASLFIIPLLTCLSGDRGRGKTTPGTPGSGMTKAGVRRPLSGN